MEASPGRVSIWYRGCDTVRQYATASAPIKRVKFNEGDTIRLQGGDSLVVESVKSLESGMLLYCGDGKEYPETELSDTLSFSKPEERLLLGRQVDSPRVFDLRLDCLRRRHQIRHSPVRGFVGARMELIPHQLTIANEVASRLLPRVLLADEVGLGKTIEACLVVHRLFRSGRAERILILVPETLVHQWFVELLRRFTMQVSIFDEERCQAMEALNPELNPFLDEQVIICSLATLTASRKRRLQVVSAGWDMVVVDEAQHLAWTPESVSVEYEVVEILAAESPGLILLTATPEQLGLEGHFARLRLLDPARYTDFSAFCEERKNFGKIAKIAGKLCDAKPLTAPDWKKVREVCLANPERLEENILAVKAGDVAARQTILQELIDQHGPGRVIFRNFRSAMKGFPKRKVSLIPLPPSKSSIEEEWATDHSADARLYSLKGDSRMEWLVDFLKKKKTAKVLLICRTREKVLALEAALRSRVNLKFALFHEGLTLLQRDRNAAWFSEEEGAQILLCSEIGSEGRNFQFAHHLVLFDLPDHPDLLEQRIGRLDRIGQKKTIEIHVPYPTDSYLEVLARWYHEGLNSFEKPFTGGSEMIAQMGIRLTDLLQGRAKEKLEKFLTDTKKLHGVLAKEMEQGQDRLLQMNSSQPESADRIIAQIEIFDQDTGLDDFLLRIFDLYGVGVEEIAPRTWRAIPSAETTEVLPHLPEAGLTLTSDREKALHREEMSFLTLDHPLVSGAIELLLGSGNGNSCCASWNNGLAHGIYLETLFVIEPVAPPALHLDRFLPATPLRIVVDTSGKDVGADVNPTPEELEECSAFPLLDNLRMKNKVIPHMLLKSRQHASSLANIIQGLALKKMRTFLGGELARLKDLKTKNDHIRQEEITLLETQIQQIHERISHTQLRLDAVRLIWQKPEG